MSWACAATSGEQAVVGWPALIWAAQLFMSFVYCSTDGGFQLTPINVATTAKAAPTPPAIFLFFGSMSLSMKIRTISGRKAISVMIAPNWFWKKNLAVSDSRAGSCLLAAFHNRLPPIAKTAITTSRPIRSGRLPWSNLWLRSMTMPAISVPIATIHDSTANRRRRLAADAWPWVARHSLVTSTCSDGLLSDMLWFPLPTRLHDEPLNAKPNPTSEASQYAAQTVRGQS